MKPGNEEKKSRFRIEKLEERIAPARGGVPGPDGNAGDHPSDDAPSPKTIGPEPHAAAHAGGATHGDTGDVDAHGP